jgi:hypothetical protein
MGDAGDVDVHDGWWLLVDEWLYSAWPADPD